MVDKDKKPSVKVNEVEKKDSSVNILLGKKEVKPKKSVDVLPKTGENGPIFNYVLGLLLIVGGLYLRKR
ncbi:LPXTG cell wall anchor domain-containing protein [Clostridium tetani]|uniref:LPXTG cell wall anchor domain-containing protein n=1 Tax=Clostridium tetani TaxID=1513 RepID=UPI001FB0F002|nr:LPXTG cell wall anchor domain-containing protein [Clostridium tetani]